MIFVSSFRPLDEDPSGEFTKNQLCAKESWEAVASRIFYLNSFEPRLDSRKTVFIPSEPYPPIMALMEVAASQPGWTALINADIWISPYLPVVEAKLNAKKATCAASWRWTFDPAVGIRDAKVVDFGGDFFAAKQEVWEQAYRMVDERLRIGAVFWDTALLSFFHTFHTASFWNITNSRVVFHPLHTGRKYGPGVDHNTVQTYGYPVMSSSHL